jgi:hypothetical protein
MRRIEKLRAELVKFLSLSNDSELHWSYAQIIFPSWIHRPGCLNEGATIARWS